MSEELKRQKRAAALKYDAETDTAPVVLAKGGDDTAEEIIRLASVHGIPVMEDRGLLTLLMGLELDTEIPPPLYEAAAAVFRKLYELDRGYNAQVTG